MKYAGLETNHSTTSKIKSPANRGAGPANSHPPHPNVIIKDALEGQSSPPTDLRGEERAQGPASRRRFAPPNAHQSSKVDG